MATSQNGWPAIESGSDARLAAFPWVTGKVLAGDVSTVLGYVARRFAAEVEAIDVASSWGYSYRDIAGSSTTLSNHASGTAIDLNAPRHPLGAVGTFTAPQITAIRSILAAVAPAVRWGGDYSGRKDEMHFEIDASAPAVAAVAAHLTSTTPHPSEEDKMIALARTNSSAQVWVGDGITRRRVTSQTELADIQYKIQTGFFRGTRELQWVDRIEWLGTAI